MRIARTACGAALFVGVFLAACKSEDASRDRPAGSAAASQAAATTASGPGTTPAASPAPPSATATTTQVLPESAGRPGSCHRLEPGTHDPMCNLGKDFCCENIASGREKCVPHEEAQGFHCSPDGAWLVAMGCTTSSMCGPAQKCCVEEPVAGFLQTVCAATCQHEEVCVPGLAGGECKDPKSFDCVASDASRTGGHCAARSAAGGKGVHCGARLVRVASPGSPGGRCAPSCTGDGADTCPAGRMCMGVPAVNDDGSTGEPVMACNPRPPPPTGGDAVCASISPNPMGHPCGNGKTCGPFMDYGDGRGLRSPCIGP